jgi:hypothetical protein
MATLTSPKRRSASAVTRAEFRRLENTLEECCRQLDVQFQRIAQIQAEMDQIRLAWSKIAPRTARERRGL